MNDNSAKPFGCLLGCTGIAAFLVIIFPGLAVVGYVMGIFPGIVLGAAPSLLIYLVAWWALRWATIRLLIGIGVKQLRSLRLAVNLSAAGFVIAVTVIVPTECNRPLDRATAEYQTTDIVPLQPLALAGVIAVIQPDYHFSRKLVCDTLCQHLLFEASATRVIHVAHRPDAPRVTSYRIERRSECPPPALAQGPPLKFIDREPPAEQFKRFHRRIAAGECLIEEPGRVEDADVTIQLRSLYHGAGKFSTPWRLMRDIAEVRRLEIVAADNRVLYRRTEVTTDRLMTPLFSIAAGGLLTSVSYVGWSRIRTISSPLGLRGHDALRNALASLNSGPMK
jgi:hypothetical protein